MTDLVTMSEVAVTLRQDEDCCGRLDHQDQEIRVETHDGGGGAYLVIATQRWAIDDVEAFAAQLERVLNMVRQEAKDDGR